VLVIHRRIDGLRLGLIVLVALAALRPAPPVAHAAGPVRFGIDEGYRSPDLFHQSGATWDRIDFHWDAYQPHGPTDWLGNSESTDGDVAGDLAAGMTVVGVITNPPAWATRNGSTPANLSLAFTDPQNYWAAFVSRLAQTYAGRIDQWIIWNEPDIAPGHPGSTWAGSEAEYYSLLKTANLAMHAANPNVRIIFAGTTYWSDILAGHDLFLQRVLDAGSQDPDAAANGYFFDAVDIHIYSSPYQIYSIPTAYRNVLQRYGLSKPIWISEMNVVPWNDPMSTVPRGGFRASLDEQAAYVIQAVAMAEAAGVERAAFYKMSDGTIIGGEPYGLVRNDGSWRPAYRAFQVAMQYVNVAGDTSYQSDETTSTVTVVNGKHRVTVDWSAKPTAVQLPVPPRGTTAQMIDKLGNVTTLSLPTNPAQPNYVESLAAATANTDDRAPTDYIIGGDPVVLVEDGVGDGVQVTPSFLFYPVTGFGIGGPFLDYFQHRGELRTFGYPISRPFPFQGSEVQFFQRRVLQLQPDGTVGQLNLLDAEYMPYTQINNATFPAADPTLTQSLPNPSAKDYQKRIFQFVNQTTPDQWSGIPVRFESTFTTTVTVGDVFPTGKPNPSLLPGINLELWGVPTSQPAVDPNNNNFIYQRFQRGIMHFDRTTGTTQALLLGDYFKQIITGQNIVPDLDSEAKTSPFYRQYDALAPHWVARPTQLPNTDLTFAFERQAAPP
jgi:hypothetical protein